MASRNRSEFLNDQVVRATTETKRPTRDLRRSGIHRCDGGHFNLTAITISQAKNNSDTEALFERPRTRVPRIADPRNLRRIASVEGMTGEDFPPCPLHPIQATTLHLLLILSDHDDAVAVRPHRRLDLRLPSNHSAEKKSAEFTPRRLRRAFGMPILGGCGTSPLALDGWCPNRDDWCITLRRVAYIR
jgi:hypothetical protein